MIEETDRSLDVALRTAECIRAAYAAYHAEFKAIVRRAKKRFEQCDWHGIHKDSVERLELYSSFVFDCESRIEQELAGRLDDRSLWVEVKNEYSRLIGGSHDYEIAESFFNSVTMRLSSLKRLNPDTQYSGSEANEAASSAGDGGMSESRELL